MRNTLLTGALVVLLAGAARAQDYPPMDMSWGIQQQQYMWEYGQQSAANAAQMWLDECAKLRAQGYTGPIDCPFNAMTISQSLNEGQAAFYDYLHTTQNGMNNLYNAYERYSNEGILGYGNYTNPYSGYTYQLQGNPYDHVWQAPDGQFYGGYNNGWYPDPSWGWTETERQQ